MGVVSLQGSLLLMAFLIHTVLTAPVIEENTALLGPDQIAEGNGCYYNYEHYEEGDRILTNEPCLNCTCHNRMLMCYLRVCPFTKAIGQDCKIEKKPDQCCPVITCPQVHVALLTSSTTETSSAHTAVGHLDNHGCVLDDNTFYADGAQVPSDPRKPCELCYCIRNRTACVMQECTLNVEGCKPVYQDGVCCPVRYDCDYDKVLTTPRPTAGLITTPGGPNECINNDVIYQDGEMIKNMSENACQHCYCMRGDIVCAVQDCGTPLENTECTALPAEPGQCCPSTYQCPNGTVPAHVIHGKPEQKPILPHGGLGLSQIKPETETVKPHVSQDRIGVTETNNEGVEFTSEGHQEITEKTEDTAVNNGAYSEVSSEGPKEDALIEIDTTVKPQDLPVEASSSTNEALQTDADQAAQEPEVNPEQDEVEKEFEEESHGGEEHEAEATTAPTIYTEISVENVEMNTSPPVTNRPSSTEASNQDEVVPVNADETQGPTTIEPSLGESKLPETQDSTNQQETQETNNEEEIRGTTSQPVLQETSKPGSQHSISENQVVDGQLDNQGADPQEGVIHPEDDGLNSLPEETSNQAEIQETTDQPQKLENVSPVDNQAPISLDNQEANSQQENLGASGQPEKEETQETATTPAEPPAPIQELQEFVPQETEKLGGNVVTVSETTAIPVTSTSSTTEAEPEEMPRIPGEGSCLHRGITYGPNTEVPSPHPCKRCRCVNSIIRCNDLECPEPPISLYSNCVPMPPTDDACCPTYFCEQKPSQEPEAQNHMSIDKIDEGVVEGDEISEGLVPTTLASVDEGEIAASAPGVINNIVPSTQDNPEAASENAENSLPQQSATVSQDAEGSKPSEEQFQPESEIPVEHLAPSEEQETVADTPTPQPDGSVSQHASSADDQHEQTQALPNEKIPSESHVIDGSESSQDEQAGTTLAPAEPSSDTEFSQTNAMEEVQISDENQQTTAADGKLEHTEAPLEPAGGEVSSESDVSEVLTSQPETGIHESSSDMSTAQPQQSSENSGNVFNDGETLNGKHDEISGLMETTASSVGVEDIQITNHNLDAQQINEEQKPIEEGNHAIDSQGSVTEEDNNSAAAIITEAPTSVDIHEKDEDSESSESSQAGALPTIDEAENDLTGQEKVPVSPTTAKQDIPDESSPSGLEDNNETAHPTTEGSSSANQEDYAPFVTSGPPVLFPDISHQGAPIHIPGPVGITAEDEKIGELETPIEETSQTEQPQTEDSSSASGEYQATVISEGIKDEVSYTTEGLNAIPPEAANEVISHVGGDADSSSSGDNQISESSQTSKPEIHEDANELSPPDNIPPPNGDLSNRNPPQEESKKQEDVAAPPTEQPVTEIQQGSIQSHDESEDHLTQHETISHPAQSEGADHPVEETETHGAVEPNLSPNESTHGNPEEGTDATVAPEIDQSEVGSTETTSSPIVTHGDLPVPSESLNEHKPSEDKIIFPESELEPSESLNDHKPSQDNIIFPESELEEEKEKATGEAVVHPLSEEEQPQPSEDGGQTQLSEGAQPQPSEDGQSQPSEVAQPQPSKDAQPQPSEDAHPSENAQPQPSEDAQPQPSEDTQPQPSEDSLPQPSEGGQSQPSEEALPQPSEDAQPSENALPQPSEDGQPQPSDDGQPQPSEGAQPLPSEDAQPSDNAQPQPSEGGQPQSLEDGQPQPSEGAQPQPSEGAQPQPSEEVQQSENAQPSEDAPPQPSEEALPQPSEDAQPSENAQPQPSEDGQPQPSEGAQPLPSEGALPSEDAQPQPSEDAQPPTSEDAQPQPSEDAQPQPSEDSQSQPLEDGQLPSEDAQESAPLSPNKEVESSGTSEQEKPTAVTQAPENDEVVTHIDSAGPQKVPEIANQVVETDTNTIEHATGFGHKEHPNIPSDDKKTSGSEETDQSNPSLEEHVEHVPSQHEELPESEPQVPQLPQNTPEEQSAGQVTAQEQEKPIPELGTVSPLEDHSEGHTDKAPTAEEHVEVTHTEEHQPDLTAPEIPLEQILPELEQPEKISTGAGLLESSTEGQLPEHGPSGDGQPQPSEGPEENKEPTLPGTSTQDEGESAPALVEEQGEQKPKPEQTLVESLEETALPDNANLGSEQDQKIPTSEDEPSQESEQEPQIDNSEGTTAVPASPEETSYLSGDKHVGAQSTPESSEEHSSTEGASQSEEHSESSSHLPGDNLQTTAEEGTSHIKAPIVEQTIDTQEAATALEPGNTEGSHPVSVETEMHQIGTSEPSPEIQDSQEAEKPTNFNAGDSESQPSGPEGGISSPGITSIEGLPAESAPSAPSAPESAPSAPDSAPSAPESAPSAPELAEPEEALDLEHTQPEVPSAPSTPELISPDGPSVPELVSPEAPITPESPIPEQPSSSESDIPDQPSAPGSTVPQLSSASEPNKPQPPTLEVQPTSHDQHIPVSSAGDANPDQSSHLLEETEKEHALPESSSRPVPDVPESSPLPPVEIHSTERPVMPPGLQNWSQKPYHPPEHQQHHHTTAEVPHLPEDSHYPSQPYDQDYEDEDNVSYGPGTCRYGGKVYLSAQQIPRDDPCDFCFCFRSDIICLQQSCPPPIRGCYQETIKGFCCPRYECHVSMATMVNITTTSTTTTTTVPPHFLSHHYNGSATKSGCQVKGIAYRVGERIPSTSGPCLDCRCGANGQMKCDPTVCGPQESLLRQVMAASVTKRRRR